MSVVIQVLKACGIAFDKARDQESALSAVIPDFAS